MAENQPVPDIIAKDLSILFCGINPGLMSATTSSHFARPGNRFWKALFLSGLTPRLLHPSEQQQLLSFGLGITNFVTRPSATAQELSNKEFQQGAKVLEKKVLEFQPKYLAILGIEAYRKGFGKKKLSLGLQSHRMEKTSIWLFPNPSGLNAHYSLEDFVKFFEELKVAATNS